MGDTDEDAASGAENFARLVEDNLHVARIPALLERELLRALAGQHVRQRPDSALGLGHHLVCDHEHVSGLEPVLPVCALGDQGREVGSALDLG